LNLCDNESLSILQRLPARIKMGKKVATTLVI